MAKYGYSKIELLNKSLRKNGVDEETRKKIMEAGELIKSSSSHIEKSEWCFNAMNKMDKLFDENLKQKIRFACACNLTGKRNKLCKEVNEKYKTVEERVKAINNPDYDVFGTGLKIIEKGKYEVLFTDETVTEKKCVCLDGLNKKWSNTWCYCCAGHVKHQLETLLGKEVNVKIISSVLISNGKEICKFLLEENKL